MTLIDHPDLWHDWCHVITYSQFYDDENKDSHSRAKPPSTPTKTFCRSAVAWIYERLVSQTRFWKSRPGPCYGNPFTRGGWAREIRGRTTQRDPFEITFTCCCATWEERWTSFCEHLTAIRTDGKNLGLSLRFIPFNCIYNFHLIRHWPEMPGTIEDGNHICNFNMHKLR